MGLYLYFMVKQQDLGHKKVEFFSLVSMLDIAL